MSPVTTDIRDWVEALIDKDCPTPLHWITTRRYLVSRFTEKLTECLDEIKTLREALEAACGEVLRVHDIARDLKNSDTRMASMAVHEAHDRIAERILKPAPPHEDAATHSGAVTNARIVETMSKIMDARRSRGTFIRELMKQATIRGDRRAHAEQDQDI